MKRVTDTPDVPTVETEKCVPLCGATEAYGRYVKWWQHAPLCPARHPTEDVEAARTGKRLWMTNDS